MLGNKINRNLPCQQAFLFMEVWTHRDGPHDSPVQFWWYYAIKTCKRRTGKRTVDIEKGHLCRCFTSYLPFGCTETHKCLVLGFVSRIVYGVVWANERLGNCKETLRGYALSFWYSPFSLILSGLVHALHTLYLRSFCHYNAFERSRLLEQ